MSENKKIKVAVLSNHSKALTGFGKNSKNILMGLFEDPNIEVVEIANGFRFGADLRTPWKSYGSYPSDPNVLQQIQGDGHKERMAAYGMYCLDEILKIEKPDILIGIEDIWAFDITKRPWFGKIKTVLWTTLDSLPILDMAYQVAPKVDKFLVWASFAEKEMKKKGYDVETLHGAVDYSAFYPLENRTELRQKHNIDDNFVIGFVFKNQLRKSVPNLLNGFKLFKKQLDQSEKPPKLLLHTDWKHDGNTWDIPRLIRDKEIDPNDVLATYICEKCKDYSILPYKGENLPCPHCGNGNSLVTKSNLFGVTEEQLNEVYNLMDVYCHPFTSGGQELPIQEAKAAGLITLVTNYSCGEDSCKIEDGGLPLKWEEYLEPHTQFIKATTLAESIYSQLMRVYDMEESEKNTFLANARKCIENKFSVEKIVGRLKEIIFELGTADWDWDFSDKLANLDYVPDLTADCAHEDWLIEVYFNMFGKRFTHKDVEIIDGGKLIEQDGRQKIYDYLKGVAREKNAAIQRVDLKLEDFFDGPDEKRIAVVMPESAGDVLMVNSLIQNFKELYPEYNIYFVTQPQFFPMIDDNPFVHRVIPYSAGMDNLLFWEGRGEYRGFVDMAFFPFIETQRFLGQLHNALDKDGLKILPCLT